jgi:methanogenic corrinoid protein MtbC1
MYTIKETAARTGIPVALLRAWERRYGVVEPSRTGGGYRLYDDASIDRLRTMRRLVDDGWSPSVAAAAILRGEVPPPEPRPPAGPALADASGSVGDAQLVAGFLGAAIALDPGEVEAALDRIFAAGTFETVVDRVLVPALIGLGEAWAEGRLGVAGEHAASHAVLRRLAAAFQAAGQPGHPAGSVLVGLPSGSRHELAALAFSIAARRAGLPVLYLGPDLPPGEWVASLSRVQPRAAVIGSPTRSDVAPAIDVARAIRAADPSLVVAFGGRFAPEAAAGARQPDPVVVLPDSVSAAVDALRDALAAAPAGAPA